MSHNPPHDSQYFEDEGGPEYAHGDEVYMDEQMASGQFYPEDQYPSQQSFDHEDDYLDPDAMSQDMTHSTVPDVLQLLHLCANGQAPVDASVLAEADESWEPIREWLRSHTAEEVRQATEQRDDSHRTALHLACRNQPPIDVINVFLSIAVETVEWPDNFGWLPIHYAAACLADTDVIKALTELFPKSKTTVDSRGRTPLHLVLGNGNRNNEMMAAHTVVAILSSSGAATYADFNGMLPLHYACAYGASEEALLVLTGAHYEGIRACDRNNRTPLHFALSNAGREASPMAVKHLLDLDPDLVNGNDGGSLPLRVLADFAHKFRSTGTDSTRESVQLCLRHLLNAGPIPSADFFTALQSLPVWLGEQAVIMPNVQILLNDKISQRFPTMMLLLDLVMLLLVFIFFSWNVVQSIQQKSEEREYRVSHERNLALYVSIMYFILREMIQVISFITMNAVIIWLHDLNSWTNITFIMLVTYCTVMMSQGYQEIDQFRYWAVATVLFLWLKLSAYLRQKIRGFAVFWGGMIYVLRRLTTFIVALVVMLICFTMMFMTVKLETEDYGVFCNGTITDVKSLDDPERERYFEVEQNKIEYCEFDPGFYYCEFTVAFLHTLTMLLGEVDETEFPDPVETVIFIIFMIIMVIILATVLIAIVTDSYKIIQTQRAAIVFWTNRLHFVAQVDAISNGLRNERFRKCIRWKKRSTTAEQKSSEFGKEFWKSLMDLFEDDVDGDLLSPDFWIYNLLRVLAAVLIVPAWVILGALSLGWLWPPQLRAYVSTASVSRYNEATEEELRKTQVSNVEQQVTVLKQELEKELAIARTQVVQMKSSVADQRSEILGEMKHIKRIVTMLFDQQAAQ
eukprot:CAMPEP_0178908096 /NCGR_PEP_ID=MMETSP0786-20121207/7733_1 /TAXON_ID=186022 /ORGANISM="Thalassionema frauenfeldii, Strain CCMP 1798" /LENGTH=853 /DNA_ID=CAMNT_0020579961 /DNA_START=13 /DNA_END=2574 /DNA_ORIENTATION=+